MKTATKFIVSTFLTTMGLMSIQGMARADTDFGRFAYDEPHPALQAHAVDQDRLIDAVNERMSRQRFRIQQGYRFGRLTPDEYARLMREHRDIRRQEQWFLTDRYLDRREYAVLNQALDRASNHIRFEKHDWDNIPPASPRFFGGPAPWGY